MGLLKFVKDAGDKLFDRNDEKEDLQRAGDLKNLVTSMGLKVDGLGVDYDDGKVVVRGTTTSQEDREKILLLIGNTQGVEEVDDQLSVVTPPAEKKPAAAEVAATMYTVQAGDTLSKIAKTHYGSANEYNAIFEANRPMLKDPNKIYPGQVLRIPPQA